MEKTIRLRKGLDIPLKGKPVQKIMGEVETRQVALVGQDYIGMKPSMAVAEGDKVKLGQLLFTDKKMPAVKYTSPGAGKVLAINRGARRAFQSIVIELEGEEAVTFPSYSSSSLHDIGEEEVKKLLVDSGWWTTLRARPFGKVADPATTPNSIFITAMDTNPHAPDLEVILQERHEDFKNGLVILSKLTSGTLYLCQSGSASIPVPDLPALKVVGFSGPHPAGNPGTHIHFLDPVDRNRIVWHIGAQDVAAVGKLFVTGRYPTDRIVAITGQYLTNPRLVKTRVGAAIEDILDCELRKGDWNVRKISGSVLSGYTAAGPTAYLGRYHQQVSVVQEGGEREFFGWLYPGLNLFSVKRILLSCLLKDKEFELTTDKNGGPRGIVPVGSYEKVMPLDILPTFLLRSLCVEDVEEAEKLGCLELIEEDLALCTFVCPAKNDYGPLLRQNLTIIEKEG